MGARDYLQILRSSVGALDLSGLNCCKYADSLTVRANTGARVPPLGALFLLLSVFILMWSVLIVEWRAVISFELILGD